LHALFKSCRSCRELRLGTRFCGTVMCFVAASRSKRNPRAALINYCLSASPLGSSNQDAYRFRLKPYAAESSSIRILLFAEQF
jgi:hypothetical protein